MTLQELYVLIEGDYEQAIKVLRIEKLLDKHIRKLPNNTVFEELFLAIEKMDGNAIFESSHAIKGLCSNLGLNKLAALSAEVCDEFRQGNARKMGDLEVKNKISQIKSLFEKTCDGIHQYEAAQ